MKKLNVYYLLIKYENLVINPIKEFTKITKFLEKISEFKFHENNIIKSIKNCSFVNLEMQENSNGFKEAPINNLGRPIKFFNLGPKNDWKKILTKEVAAEISLKFKSEMEELGYL